jgi:AcrR family transcriptional regulator
MGRPRAEVARDTRRAVLNAAGDLFAEHGYHGASMRSLAAAVGVRESALYHYFPSKEALVEGLLAEADLGGPFEEEARATTATESLEQIVTRLAGRIAALLDDPRQRRLLRLLVAAPSLGQSAAARALLDRPRRALAQLHRELRRTGRIRDDVESEVFIACLAGPPLLAGVLGDRGATAPTRRFLRQHIALLTRAFAPPRRR